MNNVPRWIYGTAWKEQATRELVLKALQCGFRAIDTANQRKHYYEAAVGEALHEAAIDRNELFLQSKFTFRPGQDDRLPYDPDATVREQVEQSFASTLKHLGTDYLDALLLHGPMFRDRLCQEDVEAWSAMEAIYHSGKVKAIGVSNFSARQLEDLNHHSAIKPGWIQNRCFAVTGWDQDVRQVCQRHGIGYQGFSLLTANPAVGQQPAFQTIVARTGLTPAQIIFQCARKMQIVPLTGTSSTEHMLEDLGCDSVPLTEEDIAVIESILVSD
ncbi:xylose reductase [Endozoicomonas montiporae]|uniref:Xylose reductase n=2 Tax=Endozoicomonas montiporae TaxID=1027273 RepID=A0A081N7L2_9GAMM|nr:aldo/keto reductase [Endozoicomonas montiporae]AMO55725.1 aldo/keto reductase [Endozoicomonas montiporae CL-33]KEQ14435.1 xylose reductase [Endozoicomonas montiporae]